MSDSVKDEKHDIGGNVDVKNGDGDDTIVDGDDDNGDDEDKEPEAFDENNGSNDDVATESVTPPSWK